MPLRFALKGLGWSLPLHKIDFQWTTKRKIIAQTAQVIFSRTNQFGQCNTYVEIGATWGWNLSDRVPQEPAQETKRKYHDI
jgi:hypothetical protein